MLCFSISQCFVDITREEETIRFDFYRLDVQRSTVRIHANKLREALSSDERIEDEDQHFAMFRPSENHLLRLVLKRKGDRVPVLLNDREVEQLRNLVA